LRELLGEQAPLSASTIIRLKDTWAADDGAWRERPITDRSADIWADGVDLGAGLKSGARAARVRENALYLVFKIVARLGQHWRVVNGGTTVMTLVLAGARFADGILVHQPPREEVEAA
jgi:putative transposase